MNAPTDNIETLRERNTVLISQKITLERRNAELANQLKQAREHLDLACTTFQKIITAPLENGFTDWENTADKMAELARRAFSQIAPENLTREEQS